MLEDYGCFKSYPNGLEFLRRIASHNTDLKALDAGRYWNAKVQNPHPQSD